MRIKIKIQIIEEDEDVILFENNYYTIKSFKTFDPAKEIEGIIDGIQIDKPIIKK
jgi:hypothetical protein